MVAAGGGSLRRCWVPYRSRGRVGNSHWGRVVNIVMVLGKNVK